MREALFWDKLPDGRVKCRLCPHFCAIGEGRRGLCGVRENAGGTLMSVNWGKLTSVSADPIEKKPLNRFMPGTHTFSCGSFGCNLACKHCQNWTIARGRPETLDVEPAEFIGMAKQYGCPSVAFTYNEPTIFFEWMLPAARAARESGLATVMVTNGYINPEPLGELLPHIDAMNIDLKAFTEPGYTKLGGTLRPVMQTIETSARRCHVEVTMLLVPGLVDSEDEVAEAARWLSGVSGDLPLHLSRCFPAYRHTAPPTDVEFMKRAAARAKEHLKYVYLGNV